MHGLGAPAAVLRADERDLARAGAPEGARLLPYFDSYLLGHRAHETVADGAHHRHVFRPAGWVAPVVLLDGRAAGVWGATIERGRLRLAVRGFRRWPRGTLARLDREARELARFLGVPYGGRRAGGAAAPPPAGPAGQPF